jgi:hypothetical protein
MAHRRYKNNLIDALASHGVPVDAIHDTYDMHGISALRHAVSMI